MSKFFLSKEKYLLYILELEEEKFKKAKFQPSKFSKKIVNSPS